MDAPQCPHCQVLLRDDPIFAGQLVACPKCGGQFRMPARGERPGSPSASSFQEEVPVTPTFGNTKFCHQCGKVIHSQAVICPHCGVPQGPVGGFAPPDPYAEAGSKKIAAGLCGILLGSLGVHKFILGMNTPGIIMLLITLIGGVVTCGVAAFVMAIIGLIEGIIYLAMRDADFYQTYIVGRREWF
jgi:TM2 domain-containing membrane protein YozV